MRKNTKADQVPRKRWLVELKLCVGRGEGVAGGGGGFVIRKVWLMVREAEFQSCAE